MPLGSGLPDHGVINRIKFALTLAVFIAIVQGALDWVVPHLGKAPSTAWSHGECTRILLGEKAFVARSATVFHKGQLALIVQRSKI